MNNKEKYLLIRFCCDVGFRDFEERTAALLHSDRCSRPGSKESSFSDEYEWIVNHIKQGNKDKSEDSYPSSIQAVYAAKILKARRLKKIQNAVISPQKIILKRAEYANKHKKSWLHSESHPDRCMYCYAVDSIDFNSECSIPNDLSREELFAIYYHCYDRNPKIRKCEYLITPCIKMM